MFKSTEKSHPIGQKKFRSDMSRSGVNSFSAEIGNDRLAFSINLHQASLRGFRFFGNEFHLAASRGERELLEICGFTRKGANLEPKCCAP